MSLKNRNIVVIDDTHSVLTFLRISLEAMGANFHGAATAAGGVALCETQNTDLVILDLGLPDRQGLIILPRLKRIHRDRNLPVIVLTAHRDQESMRQAMDLGADAYITKPFVMEELIEIINSKLSDAQESGLMLVKNESDRKLQKRLVGDKV